MTLSADARVGAAPDARSPAQLGARSWWRVARRAVATMSERNLSLVAAGVAFYGLLSMAPAIAALAAIYGLVADPAAIRTHLGLLEEVAPPAAYEAVLSQAQALDAARGRTLGWAGIIGLALSVWTARVGVGAMMTGVCIAYREPPSRGFLLDLAITWLLTLAMVVVAAVAIGAVVVTPAVVALVPLPGFAEGAARVLRWPIALLAVMAALGALYRYGPPRSDARLSWITPGAVAATGLWLAASMAFSAYVTRFGAYNETYGTLGAVAALMTWLWIGALAALFGAALNAEFELETAADTTVGPDRPMGERGAFVADNVADAPAADPGNPPPSPALSPHPQMSGDAP
jgi:membrane protein